MCGQGERKKVRKFVCMSENTGSCQENPAAFVFANLTAKTKKHM